MKVPLELLLFAFEFAGGRFLDNKANLDHNISTTTVPISMKVIAFNSPNQALFVVIDCFVAFCRPVGCSRMLADVLRGSNICPLSNKLHIQNALIDANTTVTFSTYNMLILLKLPKLSPSIAALPGHHNAF